MSKQPNMDFWKVIASTNNSELRNENLKWIKNTNVVEDDTFCVWKLCGGKGEQRMEIFSASNHHDGKGVFYARCPICHRGVNIPFVSDVK